MKKKSIPIGIRNLIIIVLVGFAILFITDKLIPLFSSISSGNYQQNWSFTTVMSYEKSTFEQLMSTADARKVIREGGIETDENNKALPIIDNMPSTEKKDSNTKEIVVFGDSFVFGEASLNRNELFWRQLEQLLRENGYNCCVKAVAMEGATAFEELEWYEEYLTTEKPDLVIFGYVYNDALIDGSKYSDSQIEYDEKIKVLIPIKALFPNIYGKITDYLNTKTMYSCKYGDPFNNTNIAVLKGKIKNYYQKNFVDKLDSITKQTKIPSIVMTLPNTPNSKMLKELYKPLDEMFKCTSIQYYNSVYSFDKFYFAKSRKNLYVNPSNTHPGSSSHYFYATYIFEKLESDFSKYLGKKQSHSTQSKIININDCTPYQIDLKCIHQSENYAEYSFNYPLNKPHSFYFFEITPYYIIYPLNKGYIKLSFENPICLNNVELTNVSSEKAEIYYTAINEDCGFDDNVLKSISKLTEEKNHLQRVTSLCIHVDDDAIINEPLKLRITKKGEI